ncbi:CHAP domain-containing protein [Weeksellaceae bacterium KMM 9724]|uniref:CHAP domain-containing protein n=1 Tax=Profundicola chukchiensis TaxID=2961959 RepID=UPI00243E758C|nr:CHAP domain-containing protein [Profundicola chukchiensis]MDG4951197.1 CHAP domain-containing protein [Profundicola chukchiensis]
MKLKHWIFIIIGLHIALFVGLWSMQRVNVKPNLEIGQEIDQFNGVNVYYNGGVRTVTGRNTTADGYNLGLKYQCVEFVKRYYYEHLNHKMPNSYGHAKDFFDKSVKDGQINKQRNLIQFTNPSQSKPKVNDLLIYKPTLFNKFGHVAIVSKVSDKEIEIIQQNPGPMGSSREKFKLKKVNGLWNIKNSRIIGWLRK